MEIATQQEIQNVKPKILNKNINYISKEDAQIVDSLEKVKQDLMFAHQSFDFATDTALTDAFIYEILSLNKKYEYYLKLCKEKGFIAGGF